MFVAVCAVACQQGGQQLHVCRDQKGASPGLAILAASQLWPAARTLQGPRQTASLFSSGKQTPAGAHACISWRLDHYTSSA